MDDVFEKIRAANNPQIHELLDAVMDRYRELNPDWEISFLSLLRSGNTNEQIDRTIQLLKHLKSC